MSHALLRLVFVKVLNRNVLNVLQKWDPEESPAGQRESQPGLWGEPVHVPGQISRTWTCFILHASSRPGTLDFCLLHRLICQHVSSFSLKSTLLCLLFSDVSDKERHEDSPGQTPHPDGEWTWQVWHFSIWTKHNLLCFFSVWTQQ